VESTDAARQVKCDCPAGSARPERSAAGVV
jgi:hypothetical protein